MDDEEYAAEELADLRLAYMLLVGYPEDDDKGLPKQKFFKDGSAEDIRARQALSRLLRSRKPLDPLLRKLLAGLFDFEPRVYAIGHEVQPDRRLEFVQIGRAREDFRQFKIAREVFDAIGSLDPDTKKPRTKTKAVEHIADRHSIGRRNVWDYVKTYERWVPTRTTAEISNS